MKKKTVALLMACVLVIGAAVGGTMAWLMDMDKPVINTFTVGDINIDLDESDINVETRTKDYEFVPGDTLAKDPKVTIEKDSEACYLFVKVEEINNNLMALNGDIIQWTIAEGWTEYEPAVSTPNTSYYYRIVEADTAAAGESWYVLKGKHNAGCAVEQNEACDCDKSYVNGFVTVNENVTKSMVSALTTKKPQLKFTAAAVQSANLATGTREEALAKVVAKLPTGFMD